MNRPSITKIVDYNKHKRFDVILHNMFADDLVSWDVGDKLKHIDKD